MCVRARFIDWLTREPEPTEVPPCDYTRLKQEIRPGDVLLIEGRSRVSNIIRSITQSPWTHAALYIGRADDIENEEIRARVEKLQPLDNAKRYIVEGLLGKGMIISPLNHYRHHHIRICRPIGLSTADSELVIAYTVKSVGQNYNVRQLFDLARFVLPWSIMPRRWASSLFTTPSGEPESGICSSMIAEAFTAVKFPILPFMTMSAETGLTLIQRNPYIFTPKDFDYSPYFEIIKYPILNPGEQLPYYRRMPWSEEQVMHQGHGVLVRPKSKHKKTSKKFMNRFISRIRKTKTDDSQK
jgi:hypothetical protein